MAPMDPQTAEAIRSWLARRALLELPPHGALFCTYEHGIAGRPIRPAWICDALKRAAARAGIEKRVHPHGLRHYVDCRVMRPA
jgi:integrase